MLIDLEWDVKHFYSNPYHNPDCKHVLFDVKDGGLSIKTNSDDAKVFCVAKRIQKGIYDMNIVDGIEFYTKYKLDFSEEWNNVPEPYGTADDLEQILEYGKSFIEDKNKFYTLALTELTQENCGDFRFEKNGKYIGKNEIKYYLADTPEIKKIILFHFYKIIEKNVPPNRPCRQCNGTGIDPKLQYRYTSSGKDERTCPKCDGEGFEIL